MIKIDGSFGEGGGQIVRNALAFSTITGKAFEVSSIRKGRKKPGLKAQHLYAVKALKELCNAEVRGDESGSSYLCYNPGEIKGKDLNIEIGTAGSITLLLQALMMPAIYSHSAMKVRLSGGTDVRWSMPFDYFRHVYLPYFPGNIKVSLKRRGYFPTGDGVVEIEFAGKKEGLKHFNLISKGKLLEVKGIVNSSSQLFKARVGKRIKDTVERILKSEGYKSHIEVEYSDSTSAGCGVVLWGIFDSPSSFPVIIGADGAGERGVTSEKVGKKAAKTFLKKLRGDFAVDVHLGDNLIPLMALSKGEIKVEKISNHTLSGIYVIEQFLGKIFEINSQENIIRRL